MKLEDFVTLKALEAKRIREGGGEMNDAVIDEFVKKEGAVFKNFCAHISIPLYEEIDSVCTSLDISKRRFLEGALIDAMRKTRAVLAEVKPFETER